MGDWGHTSRSMFVLPAIASVVIDAIALMVAWRAIAPSVVLVAFMGARLVLLALFAAMYYRERRMSLRFPLLWEVVNMALVIAKACTFLVAGAPFKDAWLLLGLCAASISLELVCVVHLYSSAGTLPRQHVFLHSAVGAMATMNLTKNPSDPSFSPTSRDGTGVTDASARTGDGSDFEGGGALLGDGENGDFPGSQRQISFDERRRFLSDWNVKVDDLRVTWKSKVDELAGKLATARRNRGWGGAEGAGGGVGGRGGEGEGAPLLLLARMFAQEQAAIEELEDMWNRDPKWTEFFLPQYTLFLLYASFAHSSRLQELLLGRCESSVQTAHTIFWFLRAFCLQGARVTPVGVKAIEQMLQDVVHRGERPAQAFCELGWGDGGEASRYTELFDAPRDGDRGARSLGGCFGDSPAFVDELVKISVELAEVEKERRTEELRRRLREVQARFLPSRAIYVPLGRKRHHVYRIAVEESFSFSTKDRAPYLVTLEVLDTRQHRPSPSSEPHAEGGGGSRHRRRGGSPDDAANGDRGDAGGGGRMLMKLLTPKALGQSLREMADNTLTTLKLGGSTREGRGGGGDGDEPEDVESQPPLPVTPSGDFLSRGSAVAPTDDGGGGGCGGSGGIVHLEDISAAKYDLGGSLLMDREAGGKLEEADGRPVDPDGVLTAGTLSISSGSGVLPPMAAAGAEDGGGGGGGDGEEAGDAGGKGNGLGSDPPSPTERREDSTGPLVSPRPPSGSAGMKRTRQMEAQRRCVEDTDGQPGEGRTSNGTGGVDGAGVRSDGRVQEDGGERSSGGSEEDDNDDIAQRLVPPSFSSTNLMGMWSRPSKQLSEGGRIGFPSPNSPPPFFGDASTASMNDDDEDKTAAAAAAAPAASNGGSSAAATQIKAGLEEGDPPHEPKGSGGAPTASTADLGMRGEDENGGVGGAEKRNVGEYASAQAGSVTPVRSAGRGSVAAAGTPVARSPEIGEREGVEALLLPPEDRTPGSGRRGGYGTATSAMATPATSKEEGRTPSPSPRSRSRKRVGGYADLRSRRGGEGGFAFEARAGEGYDEEDEEDEEEEIEEEEEEEDRDGDSGTGPPTVIFKERWRQKEARLRRASKLGQAREWRLMPVIVKAGDDLRQEQLASQFFALANRILKQSPLRARAGLRPYDIVATSPDAGVIEAIPDTVSIDALKKNDQHYTTLLNFFHRHFGPAGSEGFQRARRYFVESLAANCIVTYLLQVKDRHNGNILLDARGRVIHIDFGFMLANSPGGNFNFESAPFKLTAEFVELMDGPNSACFQGFREVCVQTFMELRRKMPRLILLLETSSVGNAHLPCFAGRPESVVSELRARFKPEAHDRAAMAHVHELVDRSMRCWRTCWYDLYQNYAVGIAM